MGDNIQLKCPQEVKAYVMREAELIIRYAELIKLEAQELAELESLVLQTEQTVAARKRAMTTALVQVKKQEVSDAQQQAIRSMSKKLATYEDQTRQIAQCREDLVRITQDTSYLNKESLLLADNSKMLSTKIQTLINKIMDAM